MPPINEGDGGHEVLVTAILAAHNPVDTILALP